MWPGTDFLTCSSPSASRKQADNDPLIQRMERLAEQDCEKDDD
jgi:hypothetical protein